MQPRRSVLFLPASNERALVKARTLDVDAVILDLEDAVAPEAKESARQAACEAVALEWGHRQVAIRVNAVGTQWHEADKSAAMAAKPDAIVLPKLDSALQAHDMAVGMPDEMELWGMIETPRAVLDVDTIAGSSRQLTTLIMGTNDLTKELHAQHVPGRAPLTLALQRVLMAARAHQLCVLDGVYNDVRDSEGFATQCQEAFNMGFDGKTLIHPGQVNIANSTWAPSPEQIEQARALMATFEAALAQGRGVVTFNGKMVESLHVETARQTLALADALASR